MCLNLLQMLTYWGRLNFFHRRLNAIWSTLSKVGHFFPSQTAVISKEIKAFYNVNWTLRPSRNYQVQSQFWVQFLQEQFIVLWSRQSAYLKVEVQLRQVNVYDSQFGAHGRFLEVRTVFCKPNAVSLRSTQHSNGQMQFLETLFASSKENRHR